jgi:GMP synthase-like glutamine amidotransferase
MLECRAGIHRESLAASIPHGNGDVNSRCQEPERPLGLPQTMMKRCTHYCEVKALPPGFEMLASSGHSKIAGMRHAEKPLHGIQFHSEAYMAPLSRRADRAQKLCADRGRVLAQLRNQASGNLWLPDAPLLDVRASLCASSCRH